MNRLTRFLPHAYFVALAGIILGPGLAPGLLFLTDMPWPAATWQLSDFTVNGIAPHFPITFVLWALSHVFPSWVLQKLVLLTVLALPGIGIYKLTRRYIRSVLLCVAAGTLAVLNPFVGERLLGGQWLVLLGYGLTAHLAAAAVAYRLKPSKRRLLNVGLLYAFLPIASLHWWYIVTILSAPYLLWLLVMRRERITRLLGRMNKTAHQDISAISARDWAPWAVLGVTLFITINSFWLGPRFVPLFTGSTFDSKDFLVFHTIPDQRYGMPLTVLNLYGFWRQVEFMPRDSVAAWPVFGIVLFALSLVGLVWLLRKPKTRWVGVYLSAILAVSLLVASGYGHPVTKAVIDTLRYLPGFEGLRDTAKLLGVVALLYAALVPLGITAIADELRGIPSLKSAWHGEKVSTEMRSLQEAGGTLLLTVLIFMMWPMLGGFNWQLHTYNYPDDWLHTADILNTTSKSSVMILPWDSYGQYAFNGGAYTANPARLLFDRPVVQAMGSDNNLLEDNTPKQRATRHIYELYRSKVLTPEQIADALRLNSIGEVVVLQNDISKTDTKIAENLPGTTLLSTPDIYVKRLP